MVLGKIAEAERGRGRALDYRIGLWMPAYFEQPFEYAVTQDLKDRLRQEYMDVKHSAKGVRPDRVLGRGEILGGLPPSASCPASAEMRPGFFESYTSFSDEAYRGKAAPISCEFLETVKSFWTAVSTSCLKLDDLDWGRMVITSGYRNPAKNARIYLEGKKSVGNSRHMFGGAIDISVAGAQCIDKFGNPMSIDDSWREYEQLVSQLKNAGVQIEREPYSKSKNYTYFHIESPQ